MSRRPTRALAKTAEPGRPASQGVKDHRAASHRHGDPGNSEPADTIARPPTDRRPGFRHDAALDRDDDRAVLPDATASPDDDQRPTESRSPVNVTGAAI